MRGAVCAICTEQFDNARDVSAIRCGHIFHADCLQAWLNRSTTCPECCQEVVQDAIIPKLCFTRPHGDDSAAGEPSSELEVSRLSSELEKVQEKLRQREKEVAELSADGSAKDDKFNRLTERYRLPLILTIYNLTLNVLSTT